MSQSIPRMGQIRTRFRYTDTSSLWARQICRSFKTDTKISVFVILSAKPDTRSTILQHLHLSHLMNKARFTIHEAGDSGLNTLLFLKHLGNRLIHKEIKITEYSTDVVFLKSYDSSQHRNTHIKCK